MKKFTVLCSLFFLLGFLQSCSHKEYPEGTYQDTVIVADGELNEWSLPLRFGSSTGTAQYNVTNDNENVYISLQTHDDATAMKILKAGVTIYIDPSAGHSKKVNLAFPLPSSTPPAEYKNNGAAGGTRPDRNEIRRSLLIQANVFKTTGFQNMENRLYDVSDKSKIKVAIRPGADNSLGYEAVIPLSCIYKNSSFTKEKNKNLSVAIQINAMTGARNYGQQNSSGNSSYSGGMRGGGGGRRGGMGGGMNGGMGGGGRRSGGYSSGENNNAQGVDRSALNKADINWYNFKLALKS